MRRRLPFRLPRVPTVVIVAVLAFVNAGIWALIIPYYQAPDEPSHVGYAVELAETGHPPRQDSNHGVASDEAFALAGSLNTFDMLQFASEIKPPWNKGQARAYEQAVAAQKLDRKNGGGPSSASVHGPVYYAFPALAYRIFYDASFTDRFLAMRWASALLAALTVAFVYLTVRELVPRRPWAPAVAALLVAFQPMFGFLGGTINADIGVNLAGAALIYLLVRALRRGLTLGLAIAIPAVFVLGVLAKATMLSFLPVAALAILILALRRSGKLRDWAAMAVTGIGLVLLWKLVVGPAWHRGFLPAPGGGGSVGTPIGLAGTLSYIWQIFLPPLPFMHHDFAAGIHPVWDIYVIRAWGSFGWLDVNFQHPIFVAVAIAMVVVILLALRGLWLERAAVRRHWAEVLVVFASFVCVAGFAHAAFARLNPAAPILEQGRYLFPAATVGAAAAIAACYGLGRRFAATGGLVLVTSMMLLSAYAQLFVFTTYFT
jgi:4-amino-4-deoxy-L-arabinose transferase-like glycosyltransferase